MKNKKIYKAIACVSVWLSVVLACVFLAIGNIKTKAGVIVENSYSFLGSGASYYIEDNNINNSIYIGVQYIANNETVNMCSIQIPTANQNNYSTQLFKIVELGFRGDINNKIMMRASMSASGNGFSELGLNVSNYTALSSKWFEDADFITYNEITYFIVPLKPIIDAFKNLSTNNTNVFTDFNLKVFCYSSSAAMFKKQNNITSVDNIYDLQQGDVAIIYISDVSGFNSSSYQPEITINWGYIDSSDNTVYAVYSPTVNVMKAPGDLEIWLNIPTDAGGTVYDSVILNQQALLTTITEGGATANANIYALYVWLLSDRIQWGLLNFNTGGLPASAMSMNYFTSYTTKYDYTNTSTGTMTCRLSISNNFNFITIKNQPVFSVNTINTTLRQGGLLPAWALYNWARGSAAGYTSGAQAGAAPYQPGNTGYNEIYQAGYNAGLTAQPAAAWYEAAFAAVDAFLDIHIFPSITFGELFGIPFVITVVYFIIRMFRGGGSNG